MSPVAACGLCALATLALAGTVRAEPRSIVLAPPAARVEIRAYGLGLVPVDGSFARFRGTLQYDPRDHAQCRVELTVEVASLQMSSADRRDAVIGPEFLDAAAFPSLVFSGGCNPSGIQGALTMHGVTRPLTLSTEWQPRQLTAQASLRRTDWGMTARRFTVGTTVRIQVTTGLLE